MINNPTDNDQCGDAREYFGYERAFPIDRKICNEIKVCIAKMEMEILMQEDYF